MLKIMENYWSILPDKIFLVCIYIICDHLASCGYAEVVTLIFRIWLELETLGLLLPSS